MLKRLDLAIAGGLQVYVQITEGPVGTQYPFGLWLGIGQVAFPGAADPGQAAGGIVAQSLQGGRVALDLGDHGLVVVEPGTPAHIAKGAIAARMVEHDIQAAGPGVEGVGVVGRPGAGVHALCRENRRQCGAVQAFGARNAVGDFDPVGIHGQAGTRCRLLGQAEAQVARFFRVQCGRTQRKRLANSSSPLAIAVDIG